MMMMIMMIELNLFSNNMCCPLMLRSIIDNQPAAYSTRLDSIQREKETKRKFEIDEEYANENEMNTIVFLRVSSIRKRIVEIDLIYFNYVITLRGVILETLSCRAS